MVLVGVSAILSSAIAMVLNPPRPRVVVGPTVLRRGATPQWTETRWTWTLKNAGNAALRIRPGGSIGCSSSIDLKHDQILTIPPGGESKVVVSWNAKSWKGRVRLGERILTDDPEVPTIDLRIEADIIPTARTPLP